MQGPIKIKPVIYSLYRLYSSTDNIYPHTRIIVINWRPTFLRDKTRDCGMTFDGLSAQTTMNGFRCRDSLAKALRTLSHKWTERRKGERVGLGGCLNIFTTPGQRARRYLYHLGTLCI